MADENSAVPSEEYILKYIKIEKSYIFIIFHNITIKTC